MVKYCRLELVLTQLIFDFVVKENFHRSNILRYDKYQTFVFHAFICALKIFGTGHPNQPLGQRSTYTTIIADPGSPYIHAFQSSCLQWAAITWTLL